MNCCLFYIANTENIGWGALFFAIIASIIANVLYEKYMRAKHFKEASRGDADHEKYLKKLASGKSMLVAWLLIFIALFFFYMLAMVTLKGADTSTRILFVVIGLGILLYPAFILFVRRKLVSKVVFTILLVIFFLPFILTSRIRGFGEGSFAGNIMSLVPEDAAVVFLIDNLDKKSVTGNNKLKDIEEFALMLKGDEIYQNSLKTDLASDIFGIDDSGKIIEPINSIATQIENVKKRFDAPELEVLNSIFGKFDIENDFLSKEILLSIFPKDGAEPLIENASRTDEDAVRVNIGEYKKFTYPESTYLLMARVSEKIKIYLNSVKYVMRYISIPEIKFKDKQGYKIVSILDSDIDIFYSLHEDVLAVSTEERLIQKFAVLALKDGNSPDNYLNSEIYMKTKALYEKDEDAKGKKLWDNCHLQILVNKDELKKLVGIEYVLNLPDEVIESEAGQFVFSLVDELIKSIFNMKILEGATLLISFENLKDTGLMLTNHCYGYFPEDKIPGVMQATYMLAPRIPALRDLVSQSIFGYFEIEKDLNEFKEYLASQTRIYNKPRSLGEILLDSIGEYVSDKICLFFQPQDLFLNSETKPRNEEFPKDQIPPPFTPLWCIGTELSAKGMELSTYDLARLILDKLIPKNNVDIPEEELNSIQFPEENINGHEIRTIGWIDKSGEDIIWNLLESTFGPQVSPCITIIEINRVKYLLISTAKDMLSGILNSLDNKSSRLNTTEGALGDLGSFELLFDNEPSNFTGRLDFRDLLENFYTKENIEILAQKYNDLNPPPSLQENFRNSAEQQAQLEGRANDEDYIMRLYRELENVYKNEMLQNQIKFTTSKLDSRQFMKVVGQFGITIRSLDAKGGFKLKTVVSIGTQTQH